MSDDWNFDRQIPERIKGFEDVVEDLVQRNEYFSVNK